MYRASTGLGNVESLIALQVRSLLCVPLTIYQRTIGCIYLDTINVADRFNEDHLQLVTAIAGISAVALRKRAAPAVARAGKPATHQRDYA